MALIQVGDTYNVPSKIYYCDTQSEFEQNFLDGDRTTPGTKVYILEDNKIMIKEDEYWGVLTQGNTGSGTGGGVIIQWKDWDWASSVQEGF